MTRQEWIDVRGPSLMLFCFKNIAAVKYTPFTERQISVNLFFVSENVIFHFLISIWTFGDFSVPGIQINEFLLYYRKTISRFTTDPSFLTLWQHLKQYFE